jgi:hypothetical protein
MSPRYTAYTGEEYRFTNLLVNVSYAVLVFLLMYTPRNLKNLVISSTF